MAISDAVQALSAAFSFGILLQAATGAFLIYFKGHGSTVFKDGRRLVLVLFLLFAALWAQVDFLNLLLTKPSTCQATLIFSTAFDQLARFLLEQFLLWSVGQRTKMNAGQIILQAILGLRLIAGGMLVGFTRPDFAPLCIARTSLEPVAIIVLVFDFVIIGVLLIRSASMGMLRDMKDSRSSTRDQSRGLLLTIVGFIVWTATSVPMILGTPTIILIVRTVVPANGLLILVGILTFSAGNLLETREEITTPEAHSPFVAPSAPSRELFRENVGGNGSPISGHNYTRSGSLFVVNPSSTPRDSPTAAQGYFQGSVPGASKLGGEVTVRDLGATEPAPRNFPRYRGSSGVFPTIITSSMSFDQGALAPNIRTNVLDSTRNVPMHSVPQPTAQQKRSLFNRSKEPVKPNIRSLKISKPVMTEDNDSSQQPFARIQTIDLAQAAVNERERREAAAERMRLVANRPAPQPPKQFTLPAEEALRRSISVKRKEMPVSQPRAPMPTITSSSSSALSVEAANGSTTSASLSPGREEVRRRSPRNANSFDALIDEKARPLPSLQRKQTLGLPSNPRATRIVPSQPMAKEQTVMFMNDIVYDNPSVVKTIIKGAPEMYALAQRAKISEKSPTASYTTDLKSSGSIIHRPRPYRKKSEGDRALFPSEPSPRHRRTKSGSSITSRKSILMSHPGSPTKLPPLPAPPTSASKLKRLLPNNTKSMTFDEKIQLLFPAPPGSLTTHNRRSSVPSLPRVPSVFMSETPMMQSPTQEEQQSRRASKRTTIASFGMPEPAIEASQGDQTGPQERQTFRFSANTYRTLADEVGETWIPGIPVNEANVGSLAPDVTDMDSHILQKPRESHMTDASSSNMSTDDDSTTYWGSIHSEIPPVDLSKVMRNANSTFIQRSRAGTLDDVKPTPPPREEEPHNGEEIMTVMLECEEGCQSIVTSSEDNRQSFFLDADQSLPGDKTPTTVKTWHRRIGDELPTFSERKASTRSRKMPPPTPLLLNQRGRGATVVVRGAEPSPPVVESPERAIAEIQAQLKRFEEPSRESVGSLLRHMPDAASTGNDAVHEDRLKLLENLENEMGQQENQWQQMQTDLHRDSVSTIATPRAPAESETDISRESSQRSSRVPSRVVSRRARIRSSMTLRSKGDESTLSSSTQSSDNSRASVWQQRLAEAQMEYMENAPALLRKRSLNFLSVSKSHQLGSPTPPDSDDSGTDMDTDSEVESENEHATVSAPQEAASLWEPQLSSPKAAAGRLWNPPYDTIERLASPEPPAKNVRPAKHQLQFSLRISSSGLWSKPTSAANSRPVVGLWGSRLVRPVSIRTRPVTQRPPRKSKRVTFLPDIIESPKPLPNKRDTLGIFQFPWGETSDSAVYQPAFNPALLAGPILNAKLDARSHQLEPESEYSSSFFDDYDEDMDEDEDADSDDDFDETTLWEIASLLKSEDVPSKKSLLPPPREIIEDYDEDEETEFEEDEDAEAMYQAAKAAQRPLTKLPIMPLSMTPKQESKEESMLWATGLTAALEVVKSGLPQPEPRVWQAYIPSTEDAVRSKRRPSQQLPNLASRDLWAISESEGTSFSASPMWSGSTTPAVIPSVTSAPKQESSYMWTPQPVQLDEHTSGLFSLDVPRSEFRTTQATAAASSMIRASRPSNAPLPTVLSKNLWVPEQMSKESKVWTAAVSVKAPAPTMWKSALKLESAAIIGLFSASHSRSGYRTTRLLPAAQNMTIKSRTSVAPLSQLTSTTLWSSLSALPYEHHWISESSIRPTSPSVYSETSSGRSSPASETSSISGASLKSTSTKASSLWGSIKSASTSGWFDIKGSRKSPSPPPVNNSKFSSNLPVAKGKALESVRESRVLASRDMWEAKAPVALGETPKRKFTVRKSTVPVPKMEEKVERQPLRQTFRRNVAFKANWDEALAEAMAAGTPKTLSRPAASKPDWEAALQEAVSKSMVQLQRLNATPEMWTTALGEAVAKSTIPIVAASPQYDPAVRHPVFFTESMVSATSDVHPAAIGYVKVSKKRVQRVKATPEMWAAALQEAITKSIIPSVVTPLRYDAAVLHPVFFTESLVSTTSEFHPAAIGHVKINSVAQYDPAVLHPVFFTSSLVSSATDMHPAAIRHVTKPQPKSLWTAPRSHVAALEAPIGPMWRKGKVAAAQFEHDKTPTIRRAVVSRSTALPRLESTSIWQPLQSAPVVGRNWISSPAKMTRSQTWTAAKQVADEENNGTWTLKTTTRASSPDMFAHHKGEHIKKSSPRLAMPPRLNSNELFTPTSIANETTHWLHTTSTSASRTAPSAGMWLAPKKAATAKKDGPDMFSHVKGEYIKKASNRPAPLSRLDSNELFSGVEKVEGETHWLQVTSSSSSSSSSLSSTPAPSSPVTTAAPKILARSQTWSARSLSQVSSEEGTSMWTSQPTQVIVQSPMMFSNPHAEPWARKKRSDSGVEVGEMGELESRQLWSRKWVMPESPKEWLVRAEKRVNKVQFRY